jgi:hypothetical protein
VLTTNAVSVGPAREFDVEDYLRNRLQFPMDELAKYLGKWVAWSADGTRIVASAADPDALDELVRAAGEDPERCPLEGIPESDAVGGGLGGP